MTALLPPTPREVVAEFHAELVGTFLKGPHRLWTVADIVLVVNNRVQELQGLLLEMGQ